MSKRAVLYAFSVNRVYLHKINKEEEENVYKFYKHTVNIFFTLHNQRWFHFDDFVYLVLFGLPCRTPKEPSSLPASFIMGDIKKIFQNVQKNVTELMVKLMALNNKGAEFHPLPMTLFQVAYI